MVEAVTRTAGPLQPDCERSSGSSHWMVRDEHGASIQLGKAANGKRNSQQIGITFSQRSAQAGFAGSSSCLSAIMALAVRRLCPGEAYVICVESLVSSVSALHALLIRCATYSKDILRVVGS